ncbi:MAG: cupin domain-containing protein [Bacteroidota bacterium]
MITQFNIEEKFGLFSDHWSPRIAGELNGQYVKLAKVQGEMVWHSHEGEDELFLVIKGTLYMDFRDGTTTTTGVGEVLIIPKGVEHLPRTNGEEVWILLFEPKETLHTGDVEHELTVNDQEWI